MDEVTEDCRRLLKKVPFDHTYTSTNIIRVIKLRIMRWAGNLVLRDTREVHKGFGCGNFTTGDNLKDLDIH